MTIDLFSMLAIGLFGLGIALLMEAQRIQRCLKQLHDELDRHSINIYTAREDLKKLKERINNEPTHRVSTKEVGGDSRPQQDSKVTKNGSGG